MIETRWRINTESDIARSLPAEIGIGSLSLNGDALYLVSDASNSAVDYANTGCDSGSAAASIIALVSGAPTKSCGVSHIRSSPDGPWQESTLGADGERVERPGHWLPAARACPPEPPKFDCSQLGTTQDLLLQGWYAQLNQNQRHAFIRSASAFARALWQLHASPQLAWLDLVVAVECISQEAVSPKDAFKNWHKGKVHDACSRVGGDQLVNELIQIVGHSVGARFKYLNFWKQFFPPEPRVRSTVMPIAEWGLEALLPSLDQVYADRSAWLHESKPLPHNLIGMPPYGAEHQYAERPSVHTFKHPPFKPADEAKYQIYLHMFCYMVQASILSWLAGRLRAAAA